MLTRELVGVETLRHLVATARAAPGAIVPVFSMIAPGGAGPSPARDELLGREAEMERVRAFLAEVEGGCASLIVDGPAGIGKSDLWSAAVDAAGGAFDVLTARCSEREAQLPYVALGDLLGDVDAPELDHLPPPVRASIEVALLRRDGLDRSLGRRGVGMALRSILERRAKQRPVLVAVDDLQWLDQESDEVLRFALHRLAGLRVGFLGTRRVDRPTEPFSVEVGGAPTEHLILDGLGAGATRRLLSRRVGSRLDRFTFQRVFDETQGNPMFALEMARAVQESGYVARPGRPLPVPADLRALLLMRYGR